MENKKKSFRQPKPPLHPLQFCSVTRHFLHAESATHRPSKNPHISGNRVELQKPLPNQHTPPTGHFRSIFSPEEVKNTDFPESGR